MKLTAERIDEILSDLSRKGLFPNKANLQLAMWEGEFKTLAEYKKYLRTQFYAVAIWMLRKDIEARKGGEGK